MLTMLPESRRRPTRPLAGTLASLAVHGALISAAVLLTIRQADANTAPPAVPVTERPVFVPMHARPAAPASVHPTTTSGGATTRPRLPADISIIPPDLPPVDVVAPAMSAPELLPGVRTAIGSGPGLAASGSLSGGANAVVGEREADRAPRVIGLAPEPRYPDALRGAGIAGHVLAQFVVDTLGRAEPGTIDVSDASRAEFADAVRAALPRFRFAPGELGGRKVRTRVQLPFTFTLR